MPMRRVERGDPLLSVLERCGEDMPYYTNIGPRSGPILQRDNYGKIDVRAAPDDRTAIGTASPIGATVGGVATWRLTVGGAEIPGIWIVLGREFRPVRWGLRSSTTV
jgi:hypothetical protein